MAKEKYRYVFPDILAKTMNKIDMRAQMQAGMLSQFLLLVGLSLMVIYMVFFGPSDIVYKILIIFNMTCGWVLISSTLVTTYQQYTNYMAAMGFDPEAEKREVRKRGNIFKRIANVKKYKREQALKAQKEDREGEFKW